MNELKPCPFCGGKAHIMKMGYPHWVICTQCGAKVHGGKFGEKEGEAASIETWNRRTSYSCDHEKDHTADSSKMVCVDAISGQAALKKLAVYIHLIDKTMGKGLLTDDDCMEAAKSVLGEDELSAIQPETNWIPCSERLPEYNESVLTWDGYIFCIEKRIPYIRDDDGEPIEGDWWVDDEYDEYESEFYPNLRDGAAIAWMPLPEPYKGGEK